MTILISGACGFMGREVAAQAKSSGIDVVCGVDIAAGVAPYQPDFPLYANYADAPKADVVIDFSNWKPGANVLDYATNEVKSALRQQDDEMASIQNVMQNCLLHA
mgnify:CR=1 FL=1